MLRPAVALLLASSLVSAEKAFGSGSIDKRQTTAASSVVCTKALWTQTNTPTGLQGPCQILGALGRKCVSDLTIEPITHSDAPYVLPTGNFNNACLCNVVAYNLIAACSWCQSGIVTGDWVTESQWSGACTSYNAKGIQSSVNTAGLVFPQWAFDSNSGLAWSAADASAEALLNEPAVTGGTAPTGATLPAGSVQSSVTTTRKPATTTYRGGGGPYIDTRAVTNVIGIIIGVIVGIYALIAIIVAIVYFKRQSSRKAWYGPMAQHYRNGGLPPWQAGAGAAAYSEQGPLLSGAAPAPTSPYPPSSQLPYTPSATPYSQNTYAPTPPPGSNYAPPTQHQQFDYGSPQPGGYAPQQYQQPQYQQPQFQQQQYGGGYHVPGYTGAAQV